MLFFNLSLDYVIQDPEVRPLHELDSSALENILPEIPLWVKCPNFERVRIVHLYWNFFSMFNYCNECQFCYMLIGAFIKLISLLIVFA